MWTSSRIMVTPVLAIGLLIASGTAGYAASKKTASDHNEAHHAKTHGVHHKHKRRHHKPSVSQPGKPVVVLVPPAPGAAGLAQTPGGDGQSTAGVIGQPTYAEAPNGGSSEPKSEPPAPPVKERVGEPSPPPTTPVIAWAHLYGIPPGGAEPMYVVVDEPGGGYGTYLGSFFNVSWAVGMPLTGTYCLASAIESRTPFDDNSPATTSDVALNTEGSGAGVTGEPSAAAVPGAPDCSAHDVEVQTYIRASESGARTLAWHVSFTVDIYQEG